MTPDVSTPTTPTAPTVDEERARARGVAILAPLDAEQREAVLALTGPTLVTAPPGTGKTRVLAHRLAYLCAAAEVPPRRILALVPSDRAGEQLKARAERLWGRPIHGAWLDTFAAVCLRILRAHAAVLGRRASFVVLGEADARTVIRRVARDLEVDRDRMAPARLQDAISAAKNARNVPAGIVGDVYRAYEAALAADNAFDQDDVMMYVLRLLEENQPLRDKYRRRFEQVLVDDYHDLNARQRELLARLAAPAGNVIAFADDDVTVAVPGGARGDSAAWFRADFPEARLHALKQNYRSTKRILHVADRLIRHDPAHTAPQPLPQRRRGRRVVIATFGDELEEAGAVVTWIRRLVARGETILSRTAVMVRQPILGRPFEEALVRAGLPYRVIGGLRFYQRREVRDVLSYLRLCIGGGDVAALARIANVPRRGIGPASVATIARLQRAAPLSIAEAALQAAQLPRVTAQRAGALADLGRLLTDLEESARRLEIPELIDYVVERAGYGAMIAELPGHDEESRREGIDELRGLGRGYPGSATQALPRLFERVASSGVVPWAGPVRRGDDDEDGERAEAARAVASAEGVQLMTYDASRGLEFEAVFLTGLEEGVLPHARALRAGGEALDFERRLLYLGVTRARSRLVLTHTLMRTLFGRPQGGEPSRFLGECGRRVRRFRLGSARPARAAAPHAAAPEEAPALLVVRDGQRVLHPTYGAGVVVRAEETGPRAAVVVRFDEAGEKRLILALARLRPA